MLEQYFQRFRDNVIGIDQVFNSPFGEQTIVYADWTASGRLYGPIEQRLMQDIAPFVGNTHTESTVTGSTMTSAYHEALHVIKEHVGGTDQDVIISSSAGMKITPPNGSPSHSNASSVEYSGTPQINDFVPSIGSTIQR